MCEAVAWAGNGSWRRPAHVYGIELHDVVGRICKINLLLHHDGHTNIEANRSCLDSTFTTDRLNPPRGKFTLPVGNPPFGTDIKEGETDQLGENSLARFPTAQQSMRVELHTCPRLPTPMPSSRS